MARPSVAIFIGVAALSVAQAGVGNTIIHPPSAFEAVSQDYLDGLSAVQPISATTRGDHRFDTHVDDLSAAGRHKLAQFDHRILSRLAKLRPAKLSREDQVDYALLDNALRYDLWRLNVLKDWAWDAQLYNDAAGNALYGLAARDFAPWPERLRAATARMEAIPGLLAQARAELVPARVPPIFAGTVAKQNSGIVEIADTMLLPHADTLSGADRARFDSALTHLRNAVAAHQKWLDSVLGPHAKGELRLGTKLYDEKMRFALMSPLSRGEIKLRAVAALRDTRQQMYTLAKQALAGHAGAPEMPDAPTDAQQQIAIEAALALTYAQRPARDALMTKATATLAQSTEFVRAHKLITLPDGPVQIITMPVFQQGVAVAYCDSPGPQERHLPTFYAVSPIPATWTDKQATSFLSEYNDYMIQDLSIHEAMPGHYVQIAHSNAAPSTLRAVLGSGAFIEGWAVYSEGMMADEGYLGDDPLFKLTVLKMRLRSITNSLLDIGLQTEGMTRDQAMTLMTRGAFQQEREAAGKWVRASLGSTQLLSYFTGYSEHMALRDEARRREGAAFNLKRYNDDVLSHGSPPARFVRELMFGLPIR